MSQKTDFQIFQNKIKKVQENIEFYNYYAEICQTMLQNYYFQDREYQYYFYPFQGHDPENMGSYLLPVNYKLLRVTPKQNQFQKQQNEQQQNEQQLELLVLLIGQCSLINGLKAGNFIKIHGVFHDIEQTLEYSIEENGNYIKNYQQIYMPSILVYDGNITENSIQNLIIVEPEMYLSPSNITGSTFCKRKVVYQNKIGSNNLRNEIMLNGVILHELFEYALTLPENDLNIDRLKLELQSIFYKNVEAIYLTGQDEDSLYKSGRYDFMIECIRKFMKNYMLDKKEIDVEIECTELLEEQYEKNNLIIETKEDQSKQKIKVFKAKIQNKHSSEEYIKVPSLGLRGFIDSICKIQIQQDPRISESQKLSEQFWPFELKTGFKFSYSHQQQTSLYILMLQLVKYSQQQHIQIQSNKLKKINLHNKNQRLSNISDSNQLDELCLYDNETNFGILYYVQQDQMKTIQLNQQKIGNILSKRNALAISLKRNEQEESDLPDVQQIKSHICQMCDYRDICISHEISQQFKQKYNKDIEDLDDEYIVDKSYGKSNQMEEELIQQEQEIIQKKIKQDQEQNQNSENSEYDIYYLVKNNEYTMPNDFLKVRSEQLIGYPFRIWYLQRWFKSLQWEQQASTLQYQITKNSLQEQKFTIQQNGFIKLNIEYAQKGKQDQTLEIQFQTQFKTQEDLENYDNLLSIGFSLQLVLESKTSNVISGIIKNIYIDQVQGTDLFNLFILVQANYKFIDIQPQIYNKYSKPELIENLNCEMTSDKLDNWIIQTYDNSSNFKLQKDFVSCLAFDLESKIPKIIIEKKDPTFLDIAKNNLISKQFLNLVEQKKKIFNEDQYQAIYKSLCAQDLFLIQGFPGTGKTFLLSHLLQLLLEQDTKQKIMITSFTHSAIDTILQKFLTLSEQLEKENNREPGYYKSRCVRFTKNSNSTAENVQDLIYSPKDFQNVKDLKIFFEQKQLFFCTILSSRQDILTKFFPFDIVIVDEASQCTEPLNIGPLSTAHKAILVGDDKQLQPLVKINSDNKGWAQGKRLKISLFERLNLRFINQPQFRQSLTQTFRMNSQITKMASTLYYKGELKRVIPDNINQQIPPQDINPKQQQFYSFQEQVVMANIDGIGGFINKQHNQNLNTSKLIIEKIIQYYYNNYQYTQSNIGIISSYNYTKDEIGKHLIDKKLIDEATIKETIYTIDKSQGIEKKIIILHIADKQGKVHLMEEERRINVAITRAIQKLIIVGSLKQIEELEQNQPDSNIVQFINYVKDNHIVDKVAI